MKKKVIIEQDEKHPIEQGILAGAICSISSSMRALLKGGLTFDAIVILTQHNCKAPYKYGAKPGIADVRSVLESVSELEQRYTRKP